MNLIINPNPKGIERSVGMTLAQQLALRCGGATKTVNIYDESGEQYFNFKFRDDWISLFKEAGRIILPVPMWNFSIPAALKDFIDKVARRGQLWDIDGNGNFFGLLEDRPVYIIMTSSGHYPPDSKEDFVVPYLKAFFASIGIKNVMDFRVGGIEGSADRVKDAEYIAARSKAMFQSFGL